MIGTPWELFRIPRIASGRLAALGHHVLRLLEGRGLILPPGNRLENAIRLSDRLNEQKDQLTADNPELAERALEAFRTIFEAYMILWAAVERPRRLDPFPNDRLRYLLEGAELPSQDSNPKARNTQFELMVGANLVLGGADIRPVEPDYELLFHDEYLGVAIKRLTSLKPGKVSSQLRAAIKQIIASSGRGFVAVNLDSWIEDLSGGSVEEVGQQFNTQLIEAHRQISKASERQALLGVLVFGTWFRCRFEGATSTIQWQSPAQYIGFGDDSSDEQRFYEFFGPFRARWEASMTELSMLLDPEQ